MPGLIIASRRWNIGSDDIIIPASIYLLLHFLWLIIYLIVCIKNGTPFLNDNCPLIITLPIFGQSILLFGFIIIELLMIKLSLLGSILNTEKRSSLNILIYIWFTLFIIDIIWEIYGLIIFYNYLNIINIKCALQTKNLIIGLKIFLLLIWLSVLLFLWCAIDYAGKSWVKMKRFEQSLNNTNSKYKYHRRSNSFHRNWRHREALRKYQQSWLNRCRWFCCVKDHRDNSFTEIAKLLSEFFRDLDVVPSDVIAGLSLIRVQQKCQRKERIMNYNSNNGDELKIFQFLSGVAITSETKFLDLTHVLVIREVYNLIHYLHYSLAIYGWPMYMLANPPSKWFNLLKDIKCCANQSSRWFKCFKCCCCCCNNCCCSQNQHIDNDTIIDTDQNDHQQQKQQQNFNRDNILGDNCCLCNRAAIQQTCIEHDYKIIYITYFVAIEKTPFFVAVDYDKMSIVISIRGTLSISDVLTDLNAEYDILPLKPPRENWYGHKGMVSAAAYIRQRLIEKHLIEIANEQLKIRNLTTHSHHQYPIIIVGHSLGAGTAAILTVLLREIYTNVICFAFAPPGGLFSSDLVEYSKDFIISIVLGKDIIPRLGLHQMEKLRFDLIKVIKNCEMSKWPIIYKSLRIGNQDINYDEFIKKFKIKSNLNNLNDNEITINNNNYNDNEQKNNNFLSIKENISTHPNDENIQLTVHTPLYPPGSIIHLVKTHPNKSDLLYEPKWRRIIGQKHYIIQALWAGNNDFNEILISPSMIRDHMPDHILEALESLLINTGPPKPKRIFNDNNNCNYFDDDDDDDIDNDYNDNNNDYNYSSINESSNQNPTTINIKNHSNINGNKNFNNNKKQFILETSFASSTPSTSITTTTTNDKVRKHSSKRNHHHHHECNNYNEERLRRLRSLISKRKAPLAKITEIYDDLMIDNNCDNQQNQNNQKQSIIVSTISNNKFDTDSIRNIDHQQQSSSNHYEQIDDITTTTTTTKPEIIKI